MYASINCLSLICISVTVKRVCRGTKCVLHGSTGLINLWVRKVKGRVCCQLVVESWVV